MDRRHFLMTSGVAGGALLAGANDTIRVACVGIRGRGNSHIKGLAKLPGVEVVALCDIDESVLDKRVKEAESARGKRPAAFTDFRKLLEDKNIDAVSIATPNHHHTLQTVWACQAGKDVYVEKPCSHNMFESRQIVAAQKKYGRIVAHGSQSRSSAPIQEAVRKMREGLIGDVYMARGLCYKWRDTIGRAKPEPIPAGVHYDEWIGPAAKREFTKNRFHYNWHWQWEYGNGDLGNQGIHQVDLARWGLGVTYPVKISAMGGHYMFDDDQETPNTMVATFEFNGAAKRKLLTFEVRHWITNSESGNSVGNLFYGSEGYLTFRKGYEVFLGKEQKPGPSPTVKLDGGDRHFANFVAAMRSRKQSDLAAPIEEGAISCDLVHLANISYRLGRTLRFDAATMTCPGDAEATKMFKRTYRAPYVVPKLA
ncbi:MAG TPA: Gfo/Idh/MocA family oxidoreductase [Bryobacteraceae bacterium]|nr:Gfo/Idh/MocA family oxidoreductase [Bryobacteraceae bacterium]